MRGWLPRRRRAVAIALGLAAVIVLCAHPLAGAATDVWGNVAPAPQLGQNGLFGRYPLGNYALDQHFDFVSASLTGGVDVSGVPPMIAYVLASILWLVTSFLANLLITLFGFAFGLDLVNGSEATGGAGALGPVARAIHSIYANVLGTPWLVAAITVAGLWAMWRSLIQRRHTETAGALALSLLYVVLAFFFVAEPGQTIGAASKLTDQMSAGFLSISDHGTPGGESQARDSAANQLFDLLVFKPWVVLDFGGLEHCALTGSGSGDSDPESAPVRPLSSDPGRDEALARRLAGGSEVSAEGKVCVNNASKYASHFLRFAPGSDERSEEYDALNDGDSSELPDADPARSGYRLGAVDRPATDAMEEGGQFQRLGLALVLFAGALGAVALLGSLSVGVILAQVLLLLLLAFSPVALIAAVIPGRGHAFFKGWLEKLAGFLLRKAAYSLILATLLAVSGALASATVSLGWLMSFGLQALFFWAVFIQRRALTESLIGIATGPGAPGREGAVRLLALYTGARFAGRISRPPRRGARSARRALSHVLGSGDDSDPSDPKPGRAPRFGATYSAPVGGGAPSLDAPGPQRSRHVPEEEGEGEPGAPPDAQPPPQPPPPPPTAFGSAAAMEPPQSDEGPGQAAAAEPEPERPPKAEAGEKKPAGERGRRPGAPPGGHRAEPVREQAPRSPRETSLAEELSAEHERPASEEAPETAPPLPAEKPSTHGQRAEEEG